MAAQMNRFPRGIWPWLTLLWGFASASTAFAQDDTEETTDPNASDTAAEGEANAEASGSVSLGGSSDVDADEDTRVAPPEGAGPGSEGKIPVAKSDGTDSETVQERAELIQFVGLEHLQGDAYPNQPIRGIDGGSLWLTFPGTQWPYMPMLSTGPGVRIGISGFGWVDTSYGQFDAGNPTDVSTTEWIQQGRLKLRVTPTYSMENDWFIQMQGEFVANSDQTQTQPQVADTDDLFIRAGKWNGWDVQVGRFQGWEVYHFGMGLDLNTFERVGARSRNNVPVGIYGVTYAWDRPQGAGNIAGHLYPTDYLRFELLGQLGNVTGQNLLAVRPVGILDMGWLKFKVGGEYQTLRPQDDGLVEIDRRGAGASLQFVLDPYVEFGVNGAQGIVDITDRNGGIDPNNSTTTNSIGGFANGRIIDGLLLGVGFNYTDQVNLHRNPATGEVDNNTHQQMFAALQYAFENQLFIKTVVALSEASFEKSFEENAVPFENNGKSVRLRVQYLF